MYITALADSDDFDATRAVEITAARRLVAGLPLLVTADVVRLFDNDDAPRMRRGEGKPCRLAPPPSSPSHSSSQSSSARLMSKS